MAKRRSEPKPKRVAYELIPDKGFGATMYLLLRELVEAHHKDVADARFALAWNKSWKADVDGRVKLGMCMKASDLDRELMAFDFVIVLQQDFWRQQSVTEDQKRALLDHELCHAAVVIDQKTSEPKEDERGRKVYRIRKHDIEEFAEIVERYGTWKRDLEVFAAALRRGTHEGFKPCDECRETPGWVAKDDKTVARCACFLAWQAQRADAARGCRGSARPGSELSQGRRRRDGAALEAPAPVRHLPALHGAG